MIYLITGANGAGKTLNALKWVRDRQVKEGRRVCHNGRFEPVETGPLSDWKKIDFQKWQDEPDGTIFFIDEAHNDLPVRPSGQKPADYIAQLAEHRRRGMDFYLVTQHPINLDSFVRRLIGSPGWHRHLKRVFGAGMVSVIEWNAVNAQCEKPGSGKSGEVSTVGFPREVFKWYKSASLHTVKRHIPRQLWYIVAAVLLVPVLGVMAVGHLKGSAAAKLADESAVIKALPAGEGARPEHVKLSADEYLAQRAPRLHDFPHTAPVYDEVTRPVVAPYPAACLHMGKTCTCYSQQATVLQVSAAVCLQIVKNGYFVDWQLPQHPERREREPFAQPIPLATPMNRPQPAMMASPAAVAQAPSGFTERKAAENAARRSVLGR